MNRRVLRMSLAVWVGLLCFGTTLPGAETPMECFDALKTACRQSNALHLRFKLTISTPNGPMQGAGAGQLCKPAAGELSISLGPTISSEPKMEVEFLGDGTKVFTLQDKQAMVLGSAWNAQLLPIRLMGLFTGELNEIPGEVDGDRIKVTHDGFVEHYSFTDGKLTQVAVKKGGEEVTLEFEEFAPKQVSDVASYHRKLPDGVKVTDPTSFGQPAAETLEVGTPCPEFEVTTHDGKTFTLSSLKGKTVLMSFWFHD